MVLQRAADGRGGSKTMGSRRLAAQEGRGPRMTMASLLIVDAVARRRRLLEVGLRRAGYRVTVAGEPQQALWFLQHSLPM